jgi:hypothetical protein
MAVIALAVRPDRPQIALGVLGGGVLVGLALWSISGMVTQLLVVGENGKNPRISRAFVLVKFFTRHAILALAAYGMMLRLHLDPVGLLIGVTSVVAGASLSALRRK